MGAATNVGCSFHRALPKSMIHAGTAFQPLSARSPPAVARAQRAYLQALISKPQTSLLVSLADKVHNAESILRDYAAIGDPVWPRFKEDTRGQSGTTEP